jgi:hypothetical protein
VTSGTCSRGGREEGREARRDPYHVWKPRRLLAVEKWRCRNVIATVRLGQRLRSPRVERQSGNAGLGGNNWGRQRRLRGNVRKWSRLRRGRSSACDHSINETSAPHGVVATRSNPSAAGFQKDPDGRARPAFSSAERCAGGEGPGCGGAGHIQRPNDRTGGGGKTGEKHREGEESDPWGRQVRDGKRRRARSDWR